MTGLSATDLITGAWRGWPLERKLALLQTLQSLRPRESILEWTVKNRPFLVPDRRLDFERRSYLVPIYLDTSQEMCIFKSSQMGASEYLISFSFYACDVLNATVLYVFPTDVHVSDFSTARMGPAIEASSYMQGIVVDAGKGRGADRIKLKRIGKRFLYCRGAKVTPTGQAPQLKAVDADVVIFDEVDEMDGRAVAIGRKRLGASSIGLVRAVSTPTYRGMGIDVWWQGSDRCEWHIRCSGCGERQFMTRDHVILEYDDLDRPVAWHGKGEGRAFAACGRCGAELDRLGPGEWIPTASSDVRGYHLTKLFSPVADLLEMVLALYTVDPTERKEALNQDWGEVYIPTGGQLTEDMLDDVRREYVHKPVGRERCVMGIDVGTLLHVVVRGPADGETGERPQRWAGVVSEFEDVKELMRRFKVSVCVVDALPETREARRFQDSCKPGQVWLAYYVTQKTGSKKEEPIQLDHGEGVVNLDRTRTLDSTMAGFLSGVFTLPASARSIPDYYRHLTTIVRVLQDHHGNKVAVYQSAADDHFAHAENYCNVAASLPVPAPAPDSSKLERDKSMWD